MVRIFTVAALLTFVAGTAAYVTASKRAQDESKVWPARKVCVISLESHVDPQGNETFTWMRWHYADTANPTAFKEVRKRIGAAGETVWGHDGDGVFEPKPDGGRLTVKDESADPKPDIPTGDPEAHTASYYIHSREYTGTDTVAGFTVYKWRASQGGGAWIEISHSPEVGGVILKSIEHHADGSEDREIAIKVEFK